MTSLSLLVLRCADIEMSKQFYSTLGLSFTLEKHGSGPEHYACVLDGTVIELYPRKEDITDKTRLGFHVHDLETIASALGAATKEGYAVVKDPDGRNVELRAYPKPI